MFRTLTGLRLDTEYLLSVSLSKRETLAPFASSGNFPFNMLFLITLDNGVLKISAKN